MLENVTLHTEATVTNAQGLEVTAQSVICENKTTIIAGLEAAKAMVKNPIAKMIVTAVVNLVEHIIESGCEK